MDTMNLQLSLIKRCPLFRGFLLLFYYTLGPRLISFIWRMSLIQGCPYRGVSLCETNEGVSNTS